MSELGSVQQQVRKVHCNSCGTRTRHFVVASRVQQGTEEVALDPGSRPLTEVTRHGRPFRMAVAQSRHVYELARGLGRVHRVAAALAQFRIRLLPCDALMTGQGVAIVEDTLSTEHLEHVRGRLSPKRSRSSNALALRLSRPPRGAPYRGSGARPTRVSPRHLGGRSPSVRESGGFLLQHPARLRE